MWNNAWRLSKEECVEKTHETLNKGNGFKLQMQCLILILSHLLQKNIDTNKHFSLHHFVKLLYVLACPNSLMQHHHIDIRKKLSCVWRPRDTGLFGYLKLGLSNSWLGVCFLYHSCWCQGLQVLSSSYVQLTQFWGGSGAVHTKSALQQSPPWYCKDLGNPCSSFGGGAHVAEGLGRPCSLYGKGGFAPEECMQWGALGPCSTHVVGEECSLLSIQPMQPAAPSCSEVEQPCCQPWTSYSGKNSWIIKVCKV